MTTPQPTAAVPEGQLTFDDDDIVARFDARYRTRDMVRRRELVHATLAALPGETILDVGCGPGFFAAELLGQVGSAGSVIGVDRSPRMLAAAALRCAGHPNITLHEADATSLPLEPASCDRALSVQVMEYVPDVGAALAELSRALRPGGRVLIWDIDWNTVSWHSDDPAGMTRVLLAWDEHLAYPSLPRTLAAQLRRAGFDDVHMAPHTYASTQLDPDSFAATVCQLITHFVTGRCGLTEADVAAWMTEQHQLAERGEFFFTCTQFCFTAQRV
ncbi:MAG: methyltransferase domain-containing protein [Pseudonocardiaceae bacterium]